MDEQILKHPQTKLVARLKQPNSEEGVVAELPDTLQQEADDLLNTYFSIEMPHTRKKILGLARLLANGADI